MDSTRSHLRRRTSARLARVDLSIGSLDLLRLVGHDHHFPRHSHEQFTVGVFDVASGRLRYRGAQWTSTDGAILAVPPDEAHEAEPFDGGWTYRAMYPSVELMALALDEDRLTATAFFGAPIFDDPLLAAELLHVHRSLLSKPACLATEEALLGALRRLVRRHAAAPAVTTTPCARAVAVTREYLEANFARPVALADLATVSRTSPFHLIRSFRDATGMPPHAYLTQVRVNRARDLLRRGEPLAGAAYLCGFCDQSHLTRAFKKVFGVTPGAYAVAIQRH